MFLTVCGNKVEEGIGNEPFPKVNFYIPAPSECLSHTGCQVSLLKRKIRKKLHISPVTPSY